MGIYLPLKKTYTARIAGGDYASNVTLDSDQLFLCLAADLDECAVLCARFIRIKERMRL